MIYLMIDDDQGGPFTQEELGALWEAGEIPGDAWFWYRGMPSWLPVSKFVPPSAGALLTPQASIQMVTSDEVPGFKSHEAVGIVGAEHAAGVGLISELYAAVTDAVGGRSDRIQAIMNSARHAVTAELQEQAALCGADAVIGISFGYTQFSGQSKSMLLVSASGTAVTLLFEPPGFEG
ncbi:MAG: heavy metal-binding domain-containing protein [Myxococcota bacterium]